MADTNEFTQFVTNYKTFWEEKNENPSKTAKPDSSDDGPIASTSAQVNITTELDKKTQLAAVKSKKLRAKISTKKPKEEEVHLLKKCESKTEILNSSGCWTVTDTQVPENESMKAKDASKKTNSSSSGNVGKMFQDLENKISHKLKRKLTEVKFMIFDSIQGCSEGKMLRDKLNFTGAKYFCSLNWYSRLV